MSDVYAPEYKLKLVDSILRVNPNQPGTPVLTSNNIVLGVPRPIALNDVNTAIMVTGVPAEGLYGSKEYYYNRHPVMTYLNRLLHDEVSVDLSGVYLDTVTYQMLIDMINIKYGLHLVQSDLEVNLSHHVPMGDLVDESDLVLRIATTSLLFYGDLSIRLITSEHPNILHVMDDIIHHDEPEPLLDQQDPVVPPG